VIKTPDRGRIQGLGPEVWRKFTTAISESDVSGVVDDRGPDWWSPLQPVRGTRDQDDEPGLSHEPLQGRRDDRAAPRYDVLHEALNAIFYDTDL
jgi:hypothetical protein